MMMRILTYISFVCFGILTLVAVQVTRRPLCIDSKVVEKIDRVGVKSSDYIYRCAVNRETPFSAFFGENVKSLSQQILPIERYLESIKPFRQKVRVTVYEERPFLFRVQNHDIFIGQKMISNAGFLEKAIIKIWLRENLQANTADYDLIEESLSDLVLFMANGSLNIKDVSSGTVLDKTGIRWPYVIKSVAGYCDSVWKFAEHAESCVGQRDELAMGTQRVNIKTVATKFSLRPLLTESLIESYKKLSLFEQSQIIKHLVVAKEKNKADSKNEQFLGAENSPLSLASATLSRSAEYIKDLVSENSEKAFGKYLDNELERKNFVNSLSSVSTVASFDFLFVSDAAISTESLLFKELVKTAKQNPKVQMAVRDSERIWLLPSKFSIPLKSFGAARSSKTVVQKCASFDFHYALAFANQTDKLLIVDNCDEKKVIKYSGFIRNSAEGFGLENRNVAFVQLHLPSLLMKKNQLLNIQDVFKELEKSKTDSHVSEIFGWQDLSWNKTAQAVRPKAIVDGIEMYRILETEKMN